MKKKKIDCEERYWLDENDYSEYYVIDGQQRLTTLIIFINNIIKIATERDIHNFGETDDQMITNVRKLFIFDELSTGIKKCIKFCYDDSDENNRKCFLSDILNIDTSLQYNITLYTKHLIEANETIKNLVSKLNVDELKNLYKLITKKLVFEFREINSQENECLFDENEMFETMNNRGKDLSDLELLKNRLIYLTIFFKENDGNQELRREINNAWKSIYENLGKNPAAILSDDDFLKFHYSYYYKDINRDTAKVYRDRLFIDKFSIDKLKQLDLDNIDKHTDIYCTIEDSDEEQEEQEAAQIDDIKNENNNKNNELTINNVSDYVKNISKVSAIWFKINNPEFTGAIANETEKKLLVKFKRLNKGRELFLPIIIASYERNTENNDRIKLLQSIERYVFIFFYMLRIGYGFGINKTKFQATFYELADSYRKNLIGINEVISTINQKLQEILALKHNEFDTYLSLGDEGYYKWGGLYYLLFEYEEYLYKEFGGAEPISWESFKTNEKDLMSIEHIYPQTPETERRPDDANWWHSQFSSDSDEIKHKCNISLGNLLLLSMKKNRDYQNYKLEKKINGWDKEDGKGRIPGYRDGSHSEREISNKCIQNVEWTKEYIYDRGIKLCNYIEKRWNISFGNNENKSKFILLHELYNEQGYAKFDVGIDENFVNQQLN